MNKFVKYSHLSSFVFFIFMIINFFVIIITRRQELLVANNGFSYLIILFLLCLTTTALWSAIVLSRAWDTRINIGLLIAWAIFGAIYFILIPDMERAVVHNAIGTATIIGVLLFGPILNGFMLLRYGPKRVFKFKKEE